MPTGYFFATEQPRQQSRALHGPASLMSYNTLFFQDVFSQTLRSNPAFQVENPLKIFQ
jgi:hypothetical protein